jgi:hypothetical protein
VQARSLALQAVKKGQEYYGTVVAKIKSIANNELNEVAPSPSWFKKLTAELFTAIPQADIKNDARLKAFENIRNPLSLCSMLHGYRQHGTDLLCWTSFNDFSVLLHGDAQPAVITTRNAIKLLAAQNIAVATGHNKDKRRVITFN